MEYKKGPERGLIFRMGYHPQTAAVAVAVAVAEVAVAVDAVAVVASTADSLNPHAD